MRQIAQPQLLSAWGSPVQLRHVSMGLVRTEDRHEYLGSQTGTAMKQSGLLARTSNHELFRLLCVFLRSHTWGSSKTFLKIM